MILPTQKDEDIATLTGGFQADSPLLFLVPLVIKIYFEEFKPKVCALWQRMPRVPYCLFRLSLLHRNVDIWGRPKLCPGESGVCLPTGRLMTVMDHNWQGLKASGFENIFDYQ